MRTISTGESATLRTYHKIATVAFGPKAVAFIEQKAREAPNGLDEEVFADERQMLHLLAQLTFGEGA